MNVLLADRNSHTRLGLEMLLSREPDVTIIGTAADSGGLLALVAGTTPDLIILEARLPGLPPAELLARLKTLHPTVQIMWLCSDTTGDVSPPAGVTISVKKSDPPAVFLKAFHTLRRNPAPTHPLPTEVTR